METMEQTEETAREMMNDPYSSEPWNRYWGYTSPIESESLERTVLDRFDEPGNRLRVCYKGSVLDREVIDRSAAALAGELGRRGLRKGDRLAIMLQNQPEFVVGILAAWRMGLVVVPVNPMYRRLELEHLLSDSGARAAIVLADLIEHLERARTGTSLETLIVCGTPDEADRTHPRYEDIMRGETEGVDSSAARQEDRPSADDPAFLCYTSGTTGPAKGAMLTHRNVAMGTLVFQRIQELGADDVNFALAPLFHVTGLVAGVTVSCAVGMKLVLDYRFDASSVLEAFEREGVTFTAGPTTVFRALLQHESFTPEAFASAAKIICGGAPIPKTFSDEFRRATGQRLHSGYGMTETTSPCFGTPRTVESPIQDGIGLLALGVPAPGTRCRLLDDDGNAVPVGSPGELTIRGPQVMSEYWRNPAETDRALHDGWLRTGDIALMNDDGWFFMVDRKKNQINASGFKVWPNEVEDVLRLHPSVADAGVVGVPDPYRGETVKAVLVLTAGAEPDEAGIRAFCREYLAAYKVPAILRFVEELPKSEAGKVLKNVLVEL